VIGRGSGSTFTGSKWLIGSSIAVWSMYVKPCHKKCRQIISKNLNVALDFCVVYSNHEKQKLALVAQEKAGMA
jgi:ATP-dependent protease HslVU (ClpYQ) peptidase subunit